MIFTEFLCICQLGFVVVIVVVCVWVSKLLVDVGMWRVSE